MSYLRYSNGICAMSSLSHNRILNFNLPHKQHRLIDLYDNSGGDMPLNANAIRRKPEIWLLRNAKMSFAIFSNAREIAAKVAMDVHDRRLIDGRNWITAIQFVSLYASSSAFKQQIDDILMRLLRPSCCYYRYIASMSDILFTDCCLLLLLRTVKTIQCLCAIRLHTHTHTYTNAFIFNCDYCEYHFTRFAITHFSLYSLNNLCFFLFRQFWFGLLLWAQYHSNGSKRL